MRPTETAPAARGDAPSATPRTAPRAVLSAAGDAALAALLARRPLLAFDFDGTLAPIVATPEMARLDPRVAAGLRALAERLPVAIVSGRSVADLRQRLGQGITGFEPAYIIGSHGADDEADPAGTARYHAALQGFRADLRAATRALAAAQVRVEDKGASIALHYRLAADGAAAMAAIADLVGPWAGTLHVFSGKRVANIMAREAPDKAAAVQTLAARADAGAAFFAGDDVNDEPVFERAPPYWLTLRVGTEGATAAHWSLPGPAQMPQLLGRMLFLLGRQRA